MKPIYFMVPFWGERYRNYFLDCMYASLAPQMGPNDRWMIACPHSDVRELLKVLPAPPYWIELPEWNTDPRSRNVPDFQNYAHSLLMLRAFENRCYASLGSPDVIYSNNTVAALRRAIERGDHLMLCHGNRQDEAKVMAMIGGERNLSARRIADINVKCLHREMLPFEEGNPAQPLVPPLRWWRDGNGIIIHTHIAMPALMDFRWPRKLNLRCMKHEAFENIFLEKNFLGCQAHVVTDSDEMGVISLSPDYAPAWRNRKPRSWRTRRLGLQLGRLVWTNSGCEDIWRQQIRWHSDDAFDDGVRSRAAIVAAGEDNQTRAEWLVTWAVYLLRYRLYLGLAKIKWLMKLKRLVLRQA